MRIREKVFSSKALLRKTLSRVFSSGPCVSVADLEEATVDEGTANDCEVSATTNGCEKEFKKSICSKPGKYIFSLKS